MTGRPLLSEYPHHFADYVSLVPEDDVLAALQEQFGHVAEGVRGVTRTQELFAYAPGKWTVREVFGHMLDVERVFAHRAFCIGRADLTPLPGFDENLYAAESGAGACSLAGLAEEFALTRAANLALFRRLPDGAWLRQGVANGNAVSVRALAFMMAGHVRHHLALLRDRYGLV